MKRRRKPPSRCLRRLQANDNNQKLLRRQHVVTKGQYYISQSKKSFKGMFFKKLKLPANNSMPMQFFTETEEPNPLHRASNNFSHEENDIAISEKESFDQLTEICENNGFTLSYAKQKGPQIKKLEIFFGNFSRFNNFTPKLENLFPNLKVLCLMNLKNLNIFPDFNFWPNLSELWICECNLFGEITENLNLNKNLPNLEKLFLYSNKIKKFDQINLPKSLKEVSLANNKVETFPKAVLDLENLVDLNLANNLIDSLHIIDQKSESKHRTGDSSISNAPENKPLKTEILTLKSLKSLKVLELSANLITYPQELKYLNQLENLEKLNLANPIYNFPNPITKLKAYTILVLSYFQNHENLEYLDNFPIMMSKLKPFLSKLVNEKRKYYFMISRTVLLEYYNKVKKLEENIISINNLADAELKDIPFYFQYFKGHLK